MKGDMVTLSRRFSSRMKTLETPCSAANINTRGPTAARNQGNTQLMTPRQKKTRITFWMNISVWKGRRVSTGRGEEQEEKGTLKKLQDPVRYRQQSVRTFVHVLGEAVEDSSCWRRVEELHGASEDLMVEFVMQLGRGAQRSLHDQKKIQVYSKQFAKIILHIQLQK